MAESEEWVVITWRWRTRGATTGLEANFDLATTNRIRDGLIIEPHFRWRADEALEAAGLRQSPLE